jgi:hypothetical protein
VLPTLDPWEPSIKKNFHPRRFDCARAPKGPVVNAAKLPGVCQLAPVLFKKDTFPQHKLGPTSPNRSVSDVYAAKCGDQVFVHTKVVRRADVVARHRAYQTSGRSDASSQDREAQPPMQIFMLSHDSTSDSEYRRTMPASVAELEHLGAIFFPGHSIVGDGTTANVGGVHTGFSELHSGDPGYPLYEARRGFPKARVVDGWPWVHKEMQTRGFVTGGHFGSNPGIGAFSMRLMGFQKAPVDHYMLPLISYLGAHELWGGHTKYCYGGKTQEMLTVDYATDMLKTYPGMPGFAYAHLADVHHALDAKRGHAAGFDSPFVDWLKNTWTRELPNAFLILTADHGARVHGSDGLTSRMEERNPLLALLVPEWFQRRYPHLVATARANSAKRIVTSPFDLHATLRHLMQVGDGDRDALAQRQATGSWSTQPGYRSLFEPIAPERTCEESGVPVHFCVCHHWTTLPVQGKAVQDGAEAFVAWANTQLQAAGGKCATLQLMAGVGVGGVVEAHSLGVKHKEMAALNRETDRHGRGNHIKSNAVAGRSGGMTLKLTLHAEAVVSAGDAKNVLRKGMQFEATVQEGQARAGGGGGGYVVVNALRSDTYGDDPKCVQDALPHLRKFCVCPS